MRVPKAPEPCISGQCRSPYSCEDWGYCRNRNDGQPTRLELADRRAAAKARREQTDPNPEARHD